MVAATRTCTYWLSASEQIPPGKPVNAIRCPKEAIASVGQTQFRCEEHYVDLLAQRPAIDILGYVQGIAIWDGMDVRRRD